MHRSAQTETIHNVFVTDDGEVIEEMTEEQEQEIYEIPNGRTSRSSSPPPPPQRRSLMQHISSMTKVHGSNNNATTNNNNNHGCGGGSGGGSTSGRLRASYDLLEEEYCKLKFEQTELVALADQRKMEKQRSAELMESLEEDLMQQRNENAKLRGRKEQLQEQIQHHQQQLNRGDQRTIAVSQKGDDHASNQQLRKLWLQRDVERQKLEEAMDELQDLRLENKSLSEILQVPPTIPKDEVKRELFRMKKEHKVADLEKYLRTLTADVERLRPPTKSTPLRNRASSFVLPTMIGKEIMVDESTSHSDGHRGPEQLSQR